MFKDSKIQSKLHKKEQRYHLKTIRIAKKAVKKRRKEEIKKNRKKRYIEVDLDISDDFTDDTDVVDVEKPIDVLQAEVEMEGHFDDVRDENGCLPSVPSGCMVLPAPNVKANKVRYGRGTLRATCFCEDDPTHNNDFVVPVQALQIPLEDVRKRYRVPVDADGKVITINGEAQAQEILSMETLPELQHLAKHNPEKLHRHQIRALVRQTNYLPSAITDEVFNTSSHLISDILAIIGAIMLCSQAYAQGKLRHFFSFLIYGLMLVMVFTCSTLHHGVGLWGISIKIYNTLRLLDHLAIFLLIAGCVTPPSLIIGANSTLCLVALILVWIIALGGMAIKLIYKHFVSQCFFNVLYVLMGFCFILVIPDMYKKCGWETILWAIGGAVWYLVGLVPFQMEKPVIIPGKFAGHEIWHVFVSMGALFHFIMLYRLVLPYNIE
ncbi:AdipoR/Haemolysin-III-related like protein [Aduncisulcus paluster]|uniref:AdipoR/Haemolysin-III-related like protein n=1 Tax=Aduncisulcus paluster TaxID=2918883 RepID=A0ABQ5KN41_9EUKA|nr:AdipoR/Haemolysin-III-related like protein [Aduncisulcus paluster]|eukprot:gnl/Carplike_NY0171/1916_a2593_265.p1 GENE.gnl/Carplike_NY0171/1916_a2593_265~~gnl/Carplike_NY0171/1916_a2593_265.p1  ORF type:complete len:436 (-),score=75.40 gnl/Carplike_NY0171/1916_a2593_265:532-1839(-)